MNILIGGYFFTPKEKAMLVRHFHGVPEESCTEEQDRMNLIKNLCEQFEKDLK